MRGVDVALWLSSIADNPPGTLGGVVVGASEGAADPGVDHGEELAEGGSHDKKQLHICWRSLVVWDGDVKMKSGRDG